MKNKIYIYSWIFLLFGMLVLPVNAQSARTELPFSITGIVTNAVTGAPIPGVHVDVVGISSSITEDNGTYTLKIPSKNVIVRVTALEYATREISVKGREKIDIVLYDKNYKGAQKDVYYSAGEVSSTKMANSVSFIKENNDLSVALTPDKLIQGYAGGLNTVFRSGAPASGTNMFLHGFNTMNAGAMPFIVVDGLPYENSVYATSLVGNYSTNPLSSIDVKDIESITVIKDGTSLYGIGFRRICTTIPTILFGNANSYLCSEVVCKRLWFLGNQWSILH